MNHYTLIICSNSAMNPQVLKILKNKFIGIKYVTKHYLINK